MRLKNYIVGNTVFDIVRDAGAEFGFADRTKLEHGWDADVAVVIEPGRVYAAFHRATRNERNVFLAVATKALADEGVIATFKEL